MAKNYLINYLIIRLFFFIVGYVTNMKIFVKRSCQNGDIFEEEKTSQQQYGILLPSFYISLCSSTPFRWWLYLKDSPLVLAVNHLIIIKLYIFIIGYVIILLAQVTYNYVQSF